MLFYLATYPRSGNSMLQRILSQNFGQLSSQVKAGAVAGLAPPEIAGWQIELAPEPIPGWECDVTWNAWTAVHRRSGPGQPWRRHLQPAPLGAFTEDFRRSLARESTAFFVKTHDRPFDRYFDGEQVLQIVRHPGPAIWSCFRYLSQHALRSRSTRRFSLPPPTLERIIAGEVQFGGWADYHRAWDEAAGRLGEACWRRSYDQMVDEQTAFRAELAVRLGLEQVSSHPVSFESYQRKRPELDLRGTNDGYEQFFSRAQLEQMWRAHGETADRLGFSPPDIERAGANEQLARLSELVELAWREARSQQAQSQRDSSSP